MFCKRIWFSKVFFKGHFTLNNGSAKQLVSNLLWTMVKVHHYYCTFTNRAGMALRGVVFLHRHLFSKVEETVWQQSRQRGETPPPGGSKVAEALLLRAVEWRVQSQPAPEQGRWSERCSPRCSHSSCRQAGSPSASTNIELSIYNNNCKMMKHFPLSLWKLKEQFCILGNILIHFGVTWKDW